MFQLPFSAPEFFAVFAAYNNAVWPAPLILTAAAIGTMALAFHRSSAADRLIAGFLAVLWGWTGAAYHVGHFRSINPAAVGFGALFIVQALLLFWWGVLRRRLTFTPGGSARDVAAGSLLVYALLIYPLLGIWSGHPYPAAPTFGTPCPVVIYTFGVLLLAPSRPTWLLVIPMIWAVIGSSAVFAFGVLQDGGLLASALITIVFQVLERRRAFGNERHQRGVVFRRLS